MNGVKSVNGVNGEKENEDIENDIGEGNGF